MEIFKFILYKRWKIMIVYNINYGIGWVSSGVEYV